MEDNEYAGTQQLVSLLGSITQLALAFPENQKIRTLAEAASSVMDAELCQAVLLENNRLQSEQNQQRQSPLAQIMGQKAWTHKN